VDADQRHDLAVWDSYRPAANVLVGLEALYTIYLIIDVAYITK